MSKPTLTREECAVACEQARGIDGVQYRQWVHDTLRNAAAYLREDAARIAELEADARRFTALRRLAALNGGVFIIHGEDVAFAGAETLQTAIGTPVETICYGLVSYGCDERDAIDKYIRHELPDLTGEEGPA